MLLKLKKELAERSDAVSGGVPWWKPSRTRLPRNMMVPKIVTPYLVFTPKFAVDIKGKYAITRAPFLVLNKSIKKEDSILSHESEENLLMYFTAVLNSRVCFWYLSTLTPFYSKGYAILESKALHGLPVPDPREIDRQLYIAIVSLVKERIALGDNERGMLIQNKIEQYIVEAYRLDDEEKRFFNII